MEDEVLKGLYQKYLSLILDISKDEEEKTNESFVIPHRYYLRKNIGNSCQIVDSKTGRVTANFKNKIVKEIDTCPGIFYVKENYSYALGYYVDIYGNVVFPVYDSIRFFDKFVSCISKGKKRGKEVKLFFNDVTGTYEKLLYDPIFLEHKMTESSSFSYKTVPIQTEDFILFKKNGKVYFYRKATGIYQELSFDKCYYMHNGLSGEVIYFDYNYDKNIIKINNTFYYVTEYDVIDITGVMKNVEWNRNVKIDCFLDEIMSYDDFKRSMLEDEEFLTIFTQKIKELKEDNYKKKVKEIKRIKEQEEKLKILKRKKELLKIINDAMKELKELNQSLNDNKAVDRLEIEEDVLLITIDDHKEINPAFKDYLSMIDLEYISFKNVKVSGLDFSYSNARINPQEVYNKDMSNSNFSGLDFNTADFRGVDIRGSIFIDCIMNFSILRIDKAIKDETTVLPKIHRI